ncbi:MAG: eukaryotic-like serine/threonine-protein kinase [Blastocatellia bacterium]|nr:eukaryotic-like serine/threonine-protein kinase [Blastocatellia bacterium]
MLQCPTCGLRYANDLQECPEDGTPLQADSTVAVALPVDPLIGRTFDDKYRLDERLGVGGMGTVYRATHLLIDRPVAVKVLNPRFVEDEAAQARFRREARAAGRLQHTNAVAVTDFGRAEDGYVYIVMELLEGVTLREVLAREAPLDTARAVSMMLQVSAAVAAAHEAGIIHRDLKPANIFIVQRPHAPAVVKVLDFGIAKLAAEAIDDDDHQTLTQVGVMIGTPRYMSPEQCDGATLTPAADVYSLGIILYEMLTSVTPFTGTSPLAVALKHSTESPRPPRELVHTIPPALEEVVLHALEKKPAERPQDAGAFRRELYATAERLGLEHAGSYGAPSIESLRSAGTETPSGRLVIDIERLRESRAAAVKSGASDTTVFQSMEDDGAQPQPSQQDQPAESVNDAPSSNITDASSSDSIAAASLASTASSSASIAAPRTQVEQGTVSRINVSLEQKHDWRYWSRQPVALALLGLAFLALIVGAVAMRSVSDRNSNGNADARAETLASPTPAASPSPSTPAESSKTPEQREANRRREAERDARPAGRKAPARQRPKGTSTMGKVKNAVKKIFKNPF